MAYAHEKGVIHRDLKPANVLVGRFGAVYVMDWGLAKLVSKEVASAESEIQLASPGAQAEDGIVGSLFYMSPEQARGENDALDERTDVYSFGAMLYELLVGHPPYSPPGAHLSQTQMLLRIREGPPPPPEELAPDMPSELCAICDKAMAYRLEGRYADMIELARDLRAYLERRVVRAHGGGALVELKKWISRNRGLSAAIALSAVLATVASFSTLLLVNENRFQAELEAQNAQLLERDALASKAIDDLIELEEELRELRKTRDDFYRERLLVEGELAETASLLEGALVEIEGWRARLSRAQALARAALVPWSEALAQRADESVADALDELVAQTQPRQRDLASDTARVFMLELVGRGLLGLGEAARAQPHLSEALQLRRVALPREERELFALTLDAIQAQIRAHADDENAEAKVTDLLGEAEKLVGRLEDPAGSHADRLSATLIEVAAWRRRRQ